MRRIAVIQIWQESNSFSPVLTTEADFDACGMGTGDEALARFSSGEEIGGFVSGLKNWSEQAVPVGLLFAQALPGGSLSISAKQFFTSILAEQLARAQPFDAVLFSLHGALVAQDEPDMDGLLLQLVRRTIGPGVPVVAALDLHGHLTPRMCKAADSVVVYHRNPHVDRSQTGRRAAAVLERILSGAKPKLSAISLPMLEPGEVTATEGALFGPIFERLREMEGQPDVLSAAVMPVQPYIDVPNLATVVAVYTDAQPALAQGLSQELAETCWRRRDQGQIELLNAQDSVAKALTYAGNPVVIADGADSVNSGAPGDSVHLLREMIKQPIPGGALTIMIDPQAVDYAKTRGPGVDLQFNVGGKLDNVFSKPLPIKGEVLSLQPANYILSGHLGDNISVDMGDSATVKIADVTLLLVQKRGFGSSPLMYRCAGLEPKDFKIVVVKSPAGFRAEFEPFAAGIVLSCCPGCAPGRLTQLEYKKIARPIWPLDQINRPSDAKWSAELHPQVG